MAGADSKFAMLRNKPNISKMGLYKVTNDKSALLRAEKETTRRITEINKLRPALERREERQLAAADAAADAAARHTAADAALAKVRATLGGLSAELDELRACEARERAAAGRAAAERDAVREGLGRLRLDLRAELAERNKQRERYRYVRQRQEASAKNRF